MKKTLLLTTCLFVVSAFFVGLLILDPHGSRNPSNGSSDAITPAPHVTNMPIIYTDNFDAANDTVALKARGYKVWYRGGGPQGPVATWFQGNSTVFSAYNGPATGYVAANYQIVTGTNNIDSWLVFPRLPGGLTLGDSLYFYSRSPDASIYPDSIRVMYSANDSVPEGSWTELGRFKVSTAGWQLKGFRNSVSTSINGRFAIRYNVVGGGPSGLNSDYIGIDAATIVNSTPPPPPYYPNVIYYKFENNPAPLLTPNCAIPPSGTNPAPIGAGLSLTTGGQFDSCLSGAGGTGNILTGWNCNLAAGVWTISFFVRDLVDLNPTYLFGDPGSTSFRCFYGGAALANNILFRGPFTDILIPCPMPGTAVFHFVYDGTNIIIYRNGTLVSTNARAVNMPTGTGFTVGGYNNTLNSMSGKMDEFKIVRYAMTPAEITATWNSDLGGCGITGIQPPVVNQIPKEFSLAQNYPNPFNPTTNIKFSVPKAGNVKLVVFDVLGKEVTTLVNGFQTAGNYVVDFNASTLSSGVYFYRLEAGDFTATKKMLLVK